MQEDIPASAPLRVLPSEILIVEDSATDQRLLREAPSAERWSVAEASHGRGARSSSPVGSST